MIAESIAICSHKHLVQHEGFKGLSSRVESLGSVQKVKLFEESCTCKIGSYKCPDSVTMKGCVIVLET